MISIFERNRSARWIISAIRSAAAKKIQFKEVLAMKIQDKETFDKVNVFGMGQENSAFAQYFICLLYTSRCV